MPRIRAQIEENIRAIENLKNKAAQRANWQSFPAVRRSGIPPGGNSIRDQPAVLSEKFDASVVLPYLRSVRLLEHQLYTNFNTLVLVHLQIYGHPVVGSLERPT